MFKKIVSEIKDAFSFFWCKQINGVVHTPYEMSNRILKITRTIYLPGQIRQVRCCVRFDLNK